MGDLYDEGNSAYAETVQKLNEHEKSKMQSRKYVDWNFAYVKSFPGLLRLFAMLTSIIAFTTSESTPKCLDVLNECLPEYHMPIYHFFGVATFLTFISSLLMTIFNVTGHAKLAFRSITLFFLEVVVLTTLTLILLISCSLMVSSTADRITLLVATVFGAASLISVCLHLSIMGLNLRSLWVSGHRIRIGYCDPKDHVSQDISPEPNRKKPPRNKRKVGKNEYSPTVPPDEDIHFKGDGAEPDHQQRSGHSDHSDKSDSDDDGSVENFAQIDFDESGSVQTKGFKKIEC